MIRDFDILGHKFKMDLDLSCIPDRNLDFCHQNNHAPEPEVLDAMNRIVRPGDVAIDGGACIGFFTLFLASLGAQVMAVEPYEPHFQRLEANLILNDMKAATFQFAFANASGGMPLYDYPSDSGQNSLARVGSTMRRVSTMMLDYFNPCRFLKLDIEGAELQVLKSSAAVQGCKIPFIICELNWEALERFGANLLDLVTFMRSAGYDCFALGKANIPLLIPPGTFIKATTLNVNVLFSTQAAVASVWNRIEL